MRGVLLCLGIKLLDCESTSIYLLQEIALCGIAYLVILVIRSDFYSFHCLINKISFRGFGLLNGVNTDGKYFSSSLGKTILVRCQNHNGLSLSVFLTIYNHRFSRDILNCELCTG